MHDFSDRVAVWYHEHKRDLPWRNTKDPYVIWLSEIILQQTRIEQGTSYFLNFIKTFPTVFDLANAGEVAVLNLWQGLGYYSRARNLHYTAKYIVSQYNGVFPDNYKELLQLKGVGDYTASAIASICFNRPTAVVDGNVYRVLSRVFGIETPINSTEGVKQFKTLAQKLIDIDNPGTHNQAVMEFGATHCKPKNPKCNSCMFRQSCVAYTTNKVAQLPVKLKKIRIKNRYFNYLVLVSKDGKTLLEKRTGKGIWENLYQFPLLESDQTKDLTKTEIETALPEQSVSSSSCYNKKPIVHKLSHQHLHIRFWIVDVASLSDEGIPIQKRDDFPVPIVLKKFMDEFFSNR